LLYLTFLGSFNCTYLMSSEFTKKKCFIEEPKRESIHVILF
jgi:hypothetical protein